MLDLFDICVAENKLHKNFISLANERNIIAQEYLKQCTKGFIDRDGKFVKEFQTSFNSSFWEIYLFSVFKKWKLNIDFSFEFPDFVVLEPFNLSVEAVISNNAINDPPEYEREYKNIPDKNMYLETIVKTATIRIANAIISKYRKYKSHYSTAEWVSNKAFILALAPYEQPFFWEQTNRAIHQVLYGYKKALYVNDDEKNIRHVYGHEYIDFIEKENGAEIPLGFFSQNMMPEISAVIFSNVATLGKIRAMTKDIDSREMIFSFSKFNKGGLHPFEGQCLKKEYSEELEDGLTLFLNPYANKKLPDSFIDLFPAFSTYDTFSKAVVGESRNNNLYNRMVKVMNVMDE